MVVLEYDAVEIDYCPSCRGIWLDAGELEMLFGDAEACDAFLNAGGPAPASREKKRPCPLCDRSMDKFVTGGDHPVTLDRCPIGEGIWLDRGELETVLAHGASTVEGEKVANLLREVFPD